MSHCCITKNTRKRYQNWYILHPLFLCRCYNEKYSLLFRKELYRVTTYYNIYIIIHLFTVLLMSTVSTLLFIRIILSYSEPYTRLTKFRCLISCAMCPPCQQQCSRLYWKAFPQFRSIDSSVGDKAAWFERYYDNINVFSQPCLKDSGNLVCKNLNSYFINFVVRSKILNFLLRDVVEVQLFQC